MNLRDLLTSFGIKVKDAGEGRQLVIHCPKGREGLHKYKQRLYIYNSKDFHCFQCGFHGNDLRVLFNELGLSSELTEGLSSGVEDRIRGSFWDALSKRGSSEARVLSLPEGYSRDWTTRDGMVASLYLQTRGLSLERIEGLGLGYGASGPYMGYILIPVYDEKRKLVYFQGRKFIPSIKGPVYKNPELADGKAWPIGKSEILYGLDRLDKSKPVILVEGVFDSLRLKNCLAMFGKSLSQAQITKLWGLGVDTVYLLLDPDAYSDALKTCEKLIKSFESVYLVNLEGAKDPGEASSSLLKKALASAMPVTKKSLIEIRSHKLFS